MLELASCSRRISAEVTLLLETAAAAILCIPYHARTYIRASVSLAFEARSFHGCTRMARVPFIVSSSRGSAANEKYIVRGHTSPAKAFRAARGIAREGGMESKCVCV